MPVNRTDRSSSDCQAAADPHCRPNRLISDLLKSSPSIAKQLVDLPANSPPSLAERLKAAIQAAPEHCFAVTPEAELFWAAAAGKLMARKPWLFERGAAAAKAKVLRLATALAADGHLNLIDVTHVEVAVAMWEYASRPEKLIDGPLQFVDEDTLSTVFWKGEPSVLLSKNNRQLFRLLYRAYRIGSFVHREVMSHAFRQLDVSEETIRQAVSRLRKQLRNDGLDEVADAIKPYRWESSGSYVLTFGSVSTCTTSNWPLSKTNT
jgi:hypothetical protein